MIKSRLFWASKTAAALVLVAATLGQAHAGQVVGNGGFESGLTGWTTADLAGSDGTFVVQSGTASPVNFDLVPAPPEGLNAAMTDGGAPGSHVLYQDFLVKTGGIGSAILRFDLFIGNRAGDFFIPAGGTLDFGVPAFNQQARVDIIKSGADVFSVAGADVLQNVFQTNPGDSPISGYTTFVVDLTSLLSAHKGETLRLRFAETDNVGPFQLGVDNVALEIRPVPEPTTILTCGLGGLIGVLAGRRRRVSPSPR